jgi:hypothetical protein
MKRTYSDLLQIASFEDRYDYLRMPSGVGVETFGFGRWMNQAFYTSREWRQVRNEVIARDLGCDLGISGREISRDLYIHHMNPIKPDDIVHHDPAILDPEYLITVSLRTHNAIHFGDKEQLERQYVPRRSGDTKLW